MYYLLLCLIFVFFFKWHKKEGLYPSTLTATDGTPHIGNIVDTGVTSQYLYDKTFKISNSEIAQQFNYLPLIKPELIS